MDPAEYDKIVSVQARSAKRGRSAEAKSSATEFILACPIGEMSSVEKGSLAEDFVYYQIRRRGYQVLRPLYPHRQLDLIVIVGNKSIRCEVKAALGRQVPLMHTTYKDGKYKRIRYEEGAVDIFFVVDLTHEHVFVIPFSEMRGKQHVGLTAGSRLWSFKDRYDLLAKV